MTTKKSFIVTDEFRKKLVALALLDEGIAEDPPNSNCTKFGEWAKENGGSNDVPWCGNAVSYWTHIASDGEYSICSGWRDVGVFRAGCDHVPSIYRWAKAKNKITNDPAIGDLILVSVDETGKPKHVGMVVEIHEIDEEDEVLYVTIEGNYGNKVRKLKRRTDDLAEQVVCFVSL